jgi:hypothetical protein
MAVEDKPPATPFDLRVASRSASGDLGPPDGGALAGGSVATAVGGRALSRRVHARDLAVAAGDECRLAGKVESAHRCLTHDSIRQPRARPKRAGCTSGEQRWGSFISVSSTLFLPNSLQARKVTTAMPGPAL